MAGCLFGFAVAALRGCSRRRTPAQQQRSFIFCWGTSSLSSSFSSSSSSSFFFFFLVSRSRTLVTATKPLASTDAGGDGGGNPRPTRSRALSLYRQLLRGAQRMPTPNRQRHVVQKTRREFKANMNLTDPKEIDFCLRLADTNLDTVLLQAEHLTRLMKDPNYHADI